MGTVTHLPNVGAILAQEYASRGWTVESTAIGLELVASATVCGVELPAGTAFRIQQFLRVHMLAGPVLELPGTGRHVFLASTAKSGSNAVVALRSLGAIVHTAGARIPLPPTYLLTGPVRWAPGSVATHLPPLVAVSAALRTHTPVRRPLVAAS